MTSLEAALRRIHADLSEAHVSFALVGGLAVSARTEPRFTMLADRCRDSADGDQYVSELRILVCLLAPTLRERAGNIGRERVKERAESRADQRSVSVAVFDDHRDQLVRCRRFRELPHARTA